jgi:DNA-binding NtrC family response regulator
MVPEPGDTTAIPAAPERARRRPDARLLIVHPPEVAGTIRLGAGETVIGRAPEGGAAIAHPTLSRRHLAVRWDGAIWRYVVADLGSKNGSSVDGAALAGAPRVLAEGAVIRAGEVLLVHDVGPEADDGAELAAALPGDAAATRQLRAQVARAGRDPSHVLLIGETGTGKEHVAQALHALSRRGGPFLAVSCAELNAELMESQLFGHARGAFTGATQAQPGLFRAAAGGTLLLDEIGELALALQPKLLRVLQEGEVLPVGEGKAVPVDVRVIAATNADVPTLVERGSFRRDLYARLAFWELHVPALRARKADILSWVQRLSARFGARRRGAVESLALTADAAEAVLAASWPDNLRGLDRLVHRLAAGRRPEEPVTLAEVTPLLAVASAAPVTAPAAEPAPLRRPAPSRDELEAMLAEHGSVRAVAKHYGRDRRQIYRWLKELGIR